MRFAAFDSACDSAVRKCSPHVCRRSCSVTKSSLLVLARGMELQEGKGRVFMHSEYDMFDMFGHDAANQMLLGI